MPSRLSALIAHPLLTTCVGALVGGAITIAVQHPWSGDTQPPTSGGSPIIGALGISGDRPVTISGRAWNVRPGQLLWSFAEADPAGASPGTLVPDVSPCDLDISGAFTCSATISGFGRYRFWVSVVDSDEVGSIVDALSCGHKDCTWAGAIPGVASPVSATADLQALP